MYGNGLRLLSVGNGLFLLLVVGSSSLLYWGDELLDRYWYRDVLFLSLQLGN
jgi:hypothetical protein